MPRLALVLVTVAWLIPVSAAEAVIVPGEGIAGAKLGMTQGEVEAVLGKPEYTIRNGSALYWAWGRPPREFRVQFSPGKVYGFYLTRRDQKTKEGVGVGSSRRAVDRLPGSRCTKYSCEIENRKLGSYTNFSLDRGKVVGITIAEQR